jgi:serine/threonine protein kinase
MVFVALVIGAYCMLKNRAAFAEASAPSGLHYPCPLLKPGTPVHNLLPTFVQTGSPAPDKYAVVDGRLPAGLQLNKRTGAISGVPAITDSALSISTFRVKASNLKGSAEFSMVLQMETSSAPAELCYKPDSFLLVDVQVSFAPILKLGVPNTRFCATDLPRGLEINPLTGVILGAPKDVVTQCSCTVTAFNDHGGTSCEVTLAVLDQQAPSGLQYPNLSEDTIFIVGEACTHKPVCYLGQPEAKFSLTPALPGGIAIDVASGIIDGTPSQPKPRGTFTVCMQNQKGRCEFKFCLEVQLQIPPDSLTYPAFDSPATGSDTQGILYCILVCGELFQPVTPDLKQGNHLSFTVDPQLPPGLEIHKSAGVITGRPTVPAKKALYTITASNRRGSTQAKILFATCFDFSQTPAKYWSVDQVQIWAQRGLNLEAKDREKLISLNARKLLSLKSLEALRRELPKLPSAVHRLLLFGIENLDRVQPPPTGFDRDDVLIVRPPQDARRGDPASESMLPSELRSEYEAICILGNGGYGTVLQASRIVKGHAQYQVAIKIFYCDRPFPENDLKRMNREAILLGRIESPHVVKLKGSGISDRASTYWLIMDFLDGKNLQELIEEQRFFTEGEVCEMTWQLLLGLEAIHTLGVVHCDVKPANVMQCAGSSKSTALFKLVDLGVAVATESNSASLATLRDQRSLRGTPGYISPEIIRNEANSIGPQADIWSLAATIFEVLTGYLPFCAAGNPNKPLLYELMSVATNLDEEPPDVASAARLPISAELGSIVKRALWKRREGRYASVEEMKAAVKAHMDDKHRDQVPVSWTPGGQTVRVALDPLQEECGEVAAFFQASLGPRFSVTALRIERVQNPGQWRQYQAKKSDMERRGNPGHGERRLFHGTDEATVPKIISTAFNRSYCGKNATAYGEGVYFARDASFSACDNYSRPNVLREKHIFLCRVLVGAYTRGDSSMRVPPPRPGTDGTFDSTWGPHGEAEPSIFVIYHDAQVPSESQSQWSESPPGPSNVLHSVIRSTAEDLRFSESLGPSFCIKFAVRSIAAYALSPHARWCTFVFSLLA